jgi:hypothetical protein
MQMVRQPVRPFPLLLGMSGIILLVTGCLSTSPAARPAATMRPLSVSEVTEFCDRHYKANSLAKDECHDRVAIARLTPGAFSDRSIWDYLDISHEEQKSLQYEQDRQAREDDLNDMATESADEATHWAEDARASARENATIQADYRIEAVKECIRAGYDEVLCMLDPENPRLD